MSCRYCWLSRCYDRRNAEIFYVNVSLAGADKCFRSMLSAETHNAESIFPYAGGEAGKIAVAADQSKAVLPAAM